MASDKELRKKIVDLALLQQYKLYEHKKNGPDTFDCAGFVWYVYKNILGIDIFDDGIGKSTTTMLMTSPIGTINYYEEDDINKDLSNLLIGDILLFHRQSLKDSEPKSDNKYPGHCGIYLGDNKFIHAPRDKGHITIHNFEKSEYWKGRLVASKDIVSNVEKQYVKKLGN